MYRICAFAIVLGFIGSGFAYGQATIELDLDGQQGNGPDTLSAAVGDEIAVEVWISGVPVVHSFHFICCRTNPVLDYLANEPGAGVASGGWSYGSSILGSNCVQIAGESELLPGGLPPLHVSTIRYAATAAGMALLEIEPDQSVWSPNSFGPDLPFDVIENAVITTGVVASDVVSWGEVKGLFR